MVKLISKPCNAVEHPDQSELDAAQAALQRLKRGVTPVGNFWIMKKLADDMDSHDKMTQPSKDEVIQAVLTVARFKLSDRVYRSNDVIAGIDSMLRGPDLNRNQYRDIQMVNHMTKGDLFLD